MYIRDTGVGMTDGELNVFGIVSIKQMKQGLLGPKRYNRNGSWSYDCEAFSYWYEWDYTCSKSNRRRDRISCYFSRIS